RRGIPLPAATEVVETAGSGMDGIVDDRHWSLRSGGAGVLRVLDSEGGSHAEIRLSDELRGDVHETVQLLVGRGLTVALLSGDHDAAARRMAAAAGINHVTAAAGPEAKAERIRTLREAGRHVVFAGDGLNDGPALAVADVGIAMAGGAASSVLVADGVITGSGIAPLLAGFRAADACRQVIRANVRRSVVYNISAVAAAAAGLVNPLVAAVLMPISSGLVIRGAFRVERLMRA